MTNGSGRPVSQDTEARTKDRGRSWVPQLIESLIGLGIVALTVAAFWLSYAHLHSVAVSNGLETSPARAWAWPATLDLFIVIGELLMLRASLEGERDKWAIGMTLFGSLGSIGLNVAGVGSGQRTLVYVVAALPPTAALFAFAVLMAQVHKRLTRKAVPVPAVLSQDTFGGQDMSRFAIPALFQDKGQDMGQVLAGQDKGQDIFQDWDSVPAVPPTRPRTLAAERVSRDTVSQSLEDIVVIGPAPKPAPVVPPVQDTRPAQRDTQKPIRDTRPAPKLAPVRQAVNAPTGQPSVSSHVLSLLEKDRDMSRDSVRTSVRDLLGQSQTNAAIDKAFTRARSRLGITA